MKEKLRAALGNDYRHYMLAAAIVLTLFSAFSVCVFYHMRNCEHVLDYYSKASSASMAKDLFSTPSYLFFAFLIPFFSFLHYFCYTKKCPFSLGERAFSANSIKNRNPEPRILLTPFINLRQS